MPDSATATLSVLEGVSLATIQDKLVKVWKLIPSRNPLVLENFPREGESLTVSQEEVIAELTNSLDSTFRRAVAGLDPYTQEYWQAADQYLTLEIASELRGQQTSQPNQVQLEEWEAEMQKLQGEQLDLVNKLKLAHPEMSAKQIYELYKAGEGTTANKTPKLSDQSTLVPASIKKAEPKAGEEPDKNAPRSAEYTKRMELLQQRAGMGGPDIRHDFNGWFHSHTVGTFRNYWQRSFGSPRTIESTEDTPGYVLYYTETAATPLYWSAGEGNWMPYYSGIFASGETSATSAFSFQKGGAGGLGGKVSFAKNFIAGENKKLAAASKAKTAAEAAANVGRLAATSGADVKAWANLAKMALQSKTLRKAAGLAASAGLATWLFLMELLGKLGIGAGIAGGMVFGASVGFFIPVIGPIGGAIIGGVVGGVGTWLWESGFFSGAGSLLGGLAAGTSTFISTVIGAGGTFLTALGSSFSALVIGGSLVVPAFLIIVNQQTINEAMRGPANGNLVTVTKTANPSTFSNNPSGEVTYAVTISTNQTQPVNISVDDSKIYDLDTKTNQVRCQLTMPAPIAAYPATISPGQSINITYNPIKITNSSGGCNYNDSVVINTVTVTANLTGEPPETDSAQAAVTIGSPPVNTISCPLAPDSSPCAVSKLLPYFDNNETKAENASRICYKENPRQDPSSVFDACTLNPPKHREYSIGLFQINLFAHDNLCAPGTFPKPLSSGPYPASDACVRDNSLLQACKIQWTSQNCLNYPGLPHPELSDCNIKEAYVLSSGGTNWSAWSTASPEYCNIK